MLVRSNVAGGVAVDVYCEPNRLNADPPDCDCDCDAAPAPGGRRRRGERGVNVADAWCCWWLRYW